MTDRRLHRQHPIKLLWLITGNFWLLLIPLVRGLIAMRFDFYSWVRGAWLDILAICLMLAAGYLRWRFTVYEYLEDGLYYRTGVIFRSETFIPYTALSAALLEKSFLLRPLRAANIYFDTSAGSVRHADVELTVSYREYLRLSRIMRRQGGGERRLRAVYRPSVGNLIFFSFFFSSALSGIIYFSTFFIQASRYVGNRLEEMLIGRINDVAARIAVGLPPTAVAISIMLGGCWLFSFICNLLRHIGFTAERRGERIELRTGFFTRRLYFINADKINYTDLRQNLMMKLFGVMSLHVSCAGYGKAKNEIPVFVPITTSRQMRSSMKLLLPGAELSGDGVRPRVRFLWRFLWLPTILIPAVPAVGAAAKYFLPEWEQMIGFAVVMCLIPSALFMAAKLTAFFTSRLSVSESGITAVYSEGLSFHTVSVQKTRIAKLRILSTPFQRRIGCVDVCIYTNSEFTKSHIIKNMPAKETGELLKRFNYIDREAEL